MNISKKWLFCGDSIVDGNHSRCGDPNHIMGHSFAFIAAAFIGAKYPQFSPKSYNTAQSGINSLRLLHSWEERVLSIDCDVLTLLVGINDTNTLFDTDKHCWQKYNATPHAYEANLRYMLYLARKKNPRLHILLGVPFYYHVDTLPEGYQERNALAEKSFTLKIRKYSQFEREHKLEDLKKRQDIVKKLAKEFQAHLLDFPAEIENAMQSAPLEYWIWDGVHPTVPCHILLFRQWLKVCRQNGIIH